MDSDSAVLEGVAAADARYPRMRPWDGGELCLDGLVSFVLRSRQAFVALRVHEPDDLLRTLEPAAARCPGRVFLALIPHPDAGTSTFRGHL